MGKSGGRRKKANASSGEGLTKLDPDDAVFLRRAHELKDEGNRHFQAKDYAGAMDIYEQALKLTPEGHPDRAVFHSNRAACLLQVKPVNYDNVVVECSLALEAHPKFGKALYRRARAYEAMGKLLMALSDVQLLLQSESNNQDALEMGKRLRLALGNNEEAQQDTQWRSSISLSPPPPDTANPPATPGADGAPGHGGRGPSLPVKPGGKKKGHSNFDPELTLRSAAEVGTSDSATLSSPQAVVVKGDFNQRKNPENIIDSVQKKLARKKEDVGAVRQLKLIFGHDIRRAEIPAGCGFGQLREVVRKRFPALKALLMKYQDSEGDLVTITSREELWLAEAEIEALGRAKKLSADSVSLPESIQDSSRPADKLPAQGSNMTLEVLRLHIVEVSPEQEPPVPEDDDLLSMTEDSLLEDETFKELPVDTAESFLESDSILAENGLGEEAKAIPLVRREDGQPAGEEMEIDDWLFDFAQLFRTQVGIDPDGHVDFHELGMELCSEALEATVTSDDAQPLFEAAACKFQEVAALALFNWGNVYMCAARKSMPIEEQSGKIDSKEQLQAAFNWAQGHYKLAGQKYEEALKIKPDFYEGVLALGQEKFESAKLQWAAAVASGVDLKTWDSTETLNLYRFAEERMKTAAEMWEQLEAQQQGAHVEGVLKGKKEPLKPESTLQDEDPGSAEHLEQGAAMRSQINLFWGNVLFEHSQVEFRVGLPSWKELLDAALEKFVAAGAASDEIEGALKNHPANLSKKNIGVNYIGSPMGDVHAKIGIDSNGDMGKSGNNAVLHNLIITMEKESERESETSSSSARISLGPDSEQYLGQAVSNEGGNIINSTGKKYVKPDMVGFGQGVPEERSIAKKSGNNSQGREIGGF